MRTLSLEGQWCVVVCKTNRMTKKKIYGPKMTGVLIRKTYTGRLNFVSPAPLYCDDYKAFLNRSWVLRTLSSRYVYWIEKQKHKSSSNFDNIVYGNCGNRCGVGNVIIVLRDILVRIWHWVPKRFVRNTDLSVSIT